MRGWPAEPGWLQSEEPPARCDLRRKQRVHQLAEPAEAAGRGRLVSPDSLPSSSSKRSNTPLKYTLCSRDKTQESYSHTPQQAESVLCSSCLTCHAAAVCFTLGFLLKVVAFGATAAVGEAEALPVHRVVVPAGETGTTRSCVGGL